MRTRSYCHGLADHPLRDDTVGQALSAAVEAGPDRPALISREQDVRWTYRELDEAVEECARALLAAEVEKGDRVGVWATNCAEWVVLQFATARIGAILVTVNPAYMRDELEHALRRSGCSLLFHSPGWRGVDYADLLERCDVPGLREAVLLDPSCWAEFLATAALASSEQLAEREAVLQPDDPINMQFTSGTTGFPKGATLSHHNIVNNAFFVGQTLNYTAADRICIPVPLYHCFGMVMGSLCAVSHGASMVFPSPAFDPAAVLAAVEAERCTSLYGVPTMFIAELAEPSMAGTDLSSLRTGIMAGAPCPVDVMEQVRSDMHMDEVTICYGMTETSPVSTQTRPDTPADRRVSSVGTVHPHVEVKIIDPESGRTVERGESGELCTRGYSVMTGYWNDDQATAEAIDRAGWMHTGDLAAMDDQGYVDIVGRSKDMILRGGENIYPREIEECLHRHPQIQDAQVVGVPDERYGERVCAWVIVSEGAELSVDDVRSYCSERIARFKVPADIRFVDSFPLTITGKVQKFKIREAEIAERESVLLEARGDHQGA